MDEQSRNNVGEGNIWENRMICRICLKIGSSGYKSVSEENIKEMIMYSVPEVDIYASPNPAICPPCLMSLLNVYNFKKKCINTEMVMRTYMTRHHLTEDDQIQLPLLIDELVKFNSYFRQQEYNKQLTVPFPPPSVVDILGPENSSAKTEVADTPNLDSNRNSIFFESLGLQENVTIDRPHFINEQELRFFKPSKKSPLVDKLFDSVPPSQHIKSVPSIISGPPPAPPPNSFQSAFQKHVAITNQRLPGKPQSPSVVQDTILNTAQHANKTTPNTVKTFPAHFVVPTDSPPVATRLDMPLQCINTVPPLRPIVPVLFEGESQVRYIPVNLISSAVIPPASQIAIRPPPPPYPQTVHVTSTVYPPHVQNAQPNVKSKILSSITTVVGSTLKREPSIEHHGIERKRRLVVKLERCKLVPTSKSRNEIDKKKDRVPNSQQQLFQCISCMYMTTSPTFFLEHKKTCSADQPVQNIPSQKEADKKCLHCLYTTCSQSEMDKHMQLMHKAQKKRYTCPRRCKMVTYDKNVFDKHVKDMLKCKVCSYLTCAVEDLTKHEDKHAQNTCPFCHYSFADRGNYRRHLFSHNPTPINCEYCDYQHNSPYAVRLHLIKYHNGVGVEDLDIKAEYTVEQIVEHIKRALDE